MPDASTMHPFYSAFDGLDVTFQGRLPSNIRTRLKQARADAQETGKSVAISLGHWPKPVAVAPSGLGQQYGLRVDTGPDGATFGFADDDHVERWNIRMSAHSLGMALHGPDGMVAQALALFDALCAEPFGGAWAIGARVGRIDYCVDFETSTFQPDPTCIVTRRTMKAATMGLIEPAFTWAQRGTRVTGLTIGKMPGRQVVIYDKIADITAKGKGEMYAIWERPRDSLAGVFRIEVRAGGDALAKGNARTLADLHGNALGVLRQTVSNIRYCVPGSSPRRDRWPVADFWERLSTMIQSRTLAPVPGAEGCAAILADKATQQRDYALRAFEGTLPGFLAAMGVDPTNTGAVLAKLAWAGQRALRNPQLDIIAKTQAKRALFQVGADIGHETDTNAGR